MLFGNVVINSVAQSELDEFRQSTIIGKKVDFILRQPKNLNPDESYPVTPVEITEEQALTLLNETKQQTWGL